MTIGFVYLIKNKINSKGYVGITETSIDERWAGHIKTSRSSSNLLIHKAIRKYGVDNFDVTLLETCDSHDISNREKFHIINEKTFVCDYPDQGYNMTKGGEYGILGYRHTDDTKRAISESLQGDKNPFFGRKHSQESIERMRLKLTGKKASPETRAKLSAAAKGRKIDPKTIEKIANANRGRRQTDEARARMSETKRRKFLESGRIRKVRQKIGRGTSVNQLDQDGNLICSYNTITEAVLKTKIHNSTIHYALKCGALAGGYLWKYKNGKNRKTPSREHMRSVTQLTLNNKIVRHHKSIKSAALTVNCHFTEIIRCCLGEVTNAGGYMWVFCKEIT
jgi:group I intron endonuclease